MVPIPWNHCQDSFFLCLLPASSGELIRSLRGGGVGQLTLNSYLNLGPYPQLLPQPQMASGHLTIDPHTQGQPPGCLPLGPRLAPASPLARLRPAGHVAEAYSPQS